MIDGWSYKNKLKYVNRLLSFWNEFRLLYVGVYDASRGAGEQKKVVDSIPAREIEIFNISISPLWCLSKARPVEFHHQNSEANVLYIVGKIFFT